MAMQQSDFRIYETDDDAQKLVSSFRSDWDFYDMLAYAAKHKTGLKMSVSQEDDGSLSIVSENFAEWAKHMTNDEKMSGHAVALYKRQLVQEFEVLVEDNDRKVGALHAVLPYMLTKSVENKS